MPAYKNYGGGNRVYLSVRNGKLMQSAKQDTAGAEPVKNKEGETKYFIVYDAIEGKITGFGTKENEYNGQKIKSFYFDVTDSENTFRIEINQDSGNFVSVATRFPNIDFDKSVVVQPAVFPTDKGGKSYFVFLKQNGENLKSAFEKEAMPKWEAITKKNGDFLSWDKTEQTTFLLNEINKLTEKLPSAHGAALSAVPNELEVTEGGDDDLPF
jgi:hypothetical protein